MRFKGVVFDLDGTLVNSLEDIADSMNKVLREYGFPTHDLGEYKVFVGRGMRNLVLMALPEDARDEARIAMCRDSLLAEYGGNYVNKTRPYEGITDLLDGLEERGMEAAVFSNKVDHLTKKIVAVLFPGLRIPRRLRLSKGNGR
jgi:phosphoglycolate phosphatase